MNQSSKPIYWQEKETWYNWVSEFVSLAPCEDAIETVLNSQCDSWYLGDSKWGDLLATISNSSIEILEGDLANLMKDRSIFLFHGCRTSDVSTYFVNGLKAQDHATILKMLEKKLIEIGSTSLDQGRVHEFLDKCEWASDENGQLFTCVDHRGLVEDAGHYVLYGSEWIQNVILRSLGSGARERLKKVGQPTIMKILWPLANSSDDCRKELSRPILREWTRFFAAELLDMRPVPNGVMDLDFSFRHNSDIPAGQVVGHWHPESVVDPFNEHKAIKTGSVTCDLCR